MPNPPRYALAVSAPGTSTASPSTCPTATVSPSLSARSRDRVGQPGRVQPAGVGDDGDAPSTAVPRHSLQLAQERPRIAEGRVAQAVAAEDQHGQLGQVVAGQHVQLAAREHLGPRVEPVAVEAGRVSDPQRLGHECVPDRLARGPPPGGPAKACAMSSQASATGPVAVRARSLRCARWVTRRQKSRAGPSTRSPRRPARTSTVYRRGRSARAGPARPGPVWPLASERVPDGAVAQVRDVPQPGGRGAADAEGVGDVVPVRPGLHQSRGGQRRGGHRRAVPGDLGTRRHGGEGLADQVARPARQRSSIAARLVEVLLGAAVDETVRVGRGRGQVAVNASGSVMARCAAASVQAR